MNTNRTRYASAPTYGMQKKSTGKKQQPLQQPTAPDFTQQPQAMQAPYPLPTYAQPGAYPQQSAGLPPMPGQSLLQPQGAPAQLFPFAQSAYPQQPAGSQPNFAAVPIPQIPQPQQQQTQPQAQAGFSARQQGYVPAPVPLATHTVIPASALNTAFSEQPTFAPYQQPQGFSAPVLQQTQAGYQGGVPLPNQQPPQITPPKKREPLGRDGWTKVFLFLFLPILFVVCLMPGTPEFLKYAFMILTILSMGAMWYMQLFTPSSRSTISIIAAALCVVLVILLVSSEDRTRPASVPSGAPVAATDAVAPDQTAEPLAPPEETVVKEEVASESKAGIRLAAFMNLWMEGRVEDMVSYVLPSWASPLEKPANNLFILLGNRTPVDFEIVSITGAEVDSSRTITMDSTIDKNNNSTPVKYRFLILMMKVSEEWYVDPNSLTSNDLETPTPSVNIKEATLNPDSPRTTTTPVPDASTKLYYNAKGKGSYYHLDPECSAVNAKWLPLDSFLYSELSEAPYKSLLPCLKCGAPLEPTE